MSDVRHQKRVVLGSIGGIYSSRSGITGVEDLGDGLHAIFAIELGINLNTGQLAQGGTALGRPGFVGLSSDKLGSLTLGRQHDTLFHFPELYTAANLVRGSLAMQPVDFDNAANSVRANNGIRYMSSNYHSLSFGSECSVGGVPDKATANSGCSLGARYRSGPLKIGAAFEYFGNRTSTPGAGLFTYNASGASPLVGSLNNAYTSAQAWRSAVIAVNYSIRAVTLVASYANAQYARLGPAFFKWDRELQQRRRRCTLSDQSFPGRRRRLRLFGFKGRKVSRWRIRRESAL